MYFTYVRKMMLFIQSIATPAIGCRTAPHHARRPGQCAHIDAATAAPTIEKMVKPAPAIVEGARSCTHEPCRGAVTSRIRIKRNCDSRTNFDYTPTTNTSNLAPRRGIRDMKPENLEKKQIVELREQIKFLVEKIDSMDSKNPKIIHVGAILSTALELLEISHDDSSKH